MHSNGMSVAGLRWWSRITSCAIYWLSVLRGWRLALEPGTIIRAGRARLGPRATVRVEAGATLTLLGDFYMDRDAEVVVYCGGHLTMGEHVYIGHGSTVACAERIQVGANTLVGDLVSVRDMNHRRIPGIPLRLSGTETRPVSIGANCWLGSKVTFVAGAEVGNDVTVAAHAVVTGRFADGMTIGGIPARPLRYAQEVTAS